MLNKKHIAMAFASAALLLSTGAARAGNVYWSIGVNALPIGGVISNAPVYSAPPPVYYPPAVYAPPVVYAPAPRVVYRPARVYYRPVPVVIGGHYHGGHGHGDHRGRGHHDRHH
jgi:hypothetical protein